MDSNRWAPPQFPPMLNLASCAENAMNCPSINTHISEWLFFLPVFFCCLLFLFPSPFVRMSCLLASTSFSWLFWKRGEMDWKRCGGRLSFDGSLWSSHQCFHLPGQEQRMALFCPHQRDWTSTEFTLWEWIFPALWRCGQDSQLRHVFNLKEVVPHLSLIRAQMLPSGGT